jgi:predicted HTH transcriptional regulator
MAALFLRRHGGQLRAGEKARTGSRRPWLRKLDPRQRKALDLFRQSDTIISRDIETLLGVSQRTARNLLNDWVRNDLLIVVDPARKSRKYGLADKYRRLLGLDQPDARDESNG